MRGLFVLIIPTSEVSKEVHEEIHDGALAESVPSIPWGLLPT